MKEKVKKKLSKVRVRRYIAKGSVVSLTSFFFGGVVHRKRIAKKKVLSIT